MRSLGRSQERKRERRRDQQPRTASAAFHRKATNTQALVKHVGVGKFNSNNVELLVLPEYPNLYVSTECEYFYTFDSLFLLFHLFRAGQKASGKWAER